MCLQPLYLSPSHSVFFSQSPSTSCSVFISSTIIAKLSFFIYFVHTAHSSHRRDALALLASRTTHLSSALHHEWNRTTYTHTPPYSLLLSVTHPKHTLTIFSDVSDADKLSAAMLRCYLVVKDLMNHAHAIPFCFPVDPAVYPG